MAAQVLGGSPIDCCANATAEAGRKRGLAPRRIGFVLASWDNGAVPVQDRSMISGIEWGRPRFLPQRASATRREEHVPIGQDAIDIESDLIDDMIDKGCV